MDNFHKKRDENTMKNRTMLITAGFGLMMILSLFIGSVGAMADSSSALGAPAADIVSVTITSPTNGTYLNFNDVPVDWTVVPAVGAVNQTRMWNENVGWTDWEPQSGDTQLFTNMTEGLHYVEVNATTDTDDIGMVANVSFTIDTINPVVEVVLPFEDQTNLANFTISWIYVDATEQSQYNVTISNETEILGSINLTGDEDSAFVVDVVGGGLDEGNYFVSVMVWDSAANFNSSGEVEFSVGPVVEFTTPAEVGVWYTNNQNFTAVWEISIFGAVDIDSQTLTIVNETGSIFMTIPSLDGDVREYAVGNVTGFNLTDGNYSITIDVQDEAGFNGTDVQAFVVDTVAPDLTIVVPDPDVLTYFNNNAFDAVWEFAPDVMETPIAVQMVTISNGTANMTLSVDPAETSVSVADVWGNVLPDGNYTIYVNATDAAANYDNESATFVIDTAAPDVAFIVPDEESDPSYTNLTEFSAVWEYEFDPLLTPITNQTVTLTNGTVFMTVDVAVGVLSVSIETIWTDNLADGAYTIYLNVTDAAGNWVNESANFVVDTVAPTLDVTYPEEFTNDNLVNATWVSDGTGSPIDNIVLTVINETGANGVYNFGPFSLGDVNNVTLADLIGFALADGTWTLEFNVTDMAGNFGITEYSFVVNVTAPTVVITSPVEGGFVNTTDVEIQFTVEPGTSQSAIEFLFIRNDSSDWIEIANITATSYVIPSLVEGAHTVYVRAYDIAGNIGIGSVNFTVDLTLPIVNITSPANDSLFGVNHVNVTWTGSDALSGLAHFEVKVDALDWENVGYNLSKNLTGLSDGVHVVKVKAVDNASNENVTSVTFSVDTTGPVVTITQPAAGLHTKVRDVQMNWTAVDTISGVAYAHVWNDSGAVVNTTNSGYMFLNLSEGAHVLHVQVWDTLGNSEAKSVSIVVDLTAPEIVFTFPVANQLVNSTAINATWIVMDALSPIAKIWVSIDDNPLVDVNLNTSQLFVNLAVGSHTIHVRANDSAGNSAMQEVTFVIEMVAPTVVTHLPASGAIVSLNATVKVTFSEAMNETSVVFSGITGTKTWNAAGTEVTLTHAALTYATTYSIVVSGKDLAGNVLTGANKTFSFTTVTLVSGIIKDDKGIPIANATVKLTQGTTVVEGLTDANGHYALIVNGGVYNLTVSKAGFQDIVQNGKTFGVGQTNTLEPIAMTPNADYTLLIVGVIVVLAIVLAALFLMRRQKIIIKK